MLLLTVECNNERYWSTVPILEYTNDALGGGPRNNNCGYILWVVVEERGAAPRGAKRALAKTEQLTIRNVFT